MLFLQFRLGADRYLIECRRVAQVLPLLELKQFPQAPAGVAGAFSYHGTPVPVLDLSQLALGRPAAPRASTRVLLVPLAEADGTSHLLGLLVEQATRTLTLEPDDFEDAGVRAPEAPYLGPVHADAHGLLQWVEPRSLLPPEVRALLFEQAREAVA